MRQRLAALALLLLPLSACYTAGTQGYGPEPEQYADYDMVPMRARLYSDYTGLRVYTNRPAYVAIFEIAPGVGASLLYPAYRSERAYLSSGSTRITLTSVRPGFFYYGADFSSTARVQPRHYLLIASRRPLNVGELQSDPGGLRRRLGYNSFTSINARSVMNDLADIVLPAENDEDWDSDILTLWPEYRTRLADYNGGGYWTGVRCYDGYEVTVPLEWLPYACYERERGYYDNGHRRNPPPPAPHDTAHHQPSDTGNVTVPGHRRPEPPTVGPEEGVGQRLAGGRPTIDPTPVFRPGIPDDRPRVEPTAAAGGTADEPQRRPREPRLEPHRFQPRDEPAGGSEGGSARVSTPRGEQPRSEPRRPEPRQAEPAREEPRANPRVETRREEPQRVEQRQEQPRQAEPRHEEPRRESPPPQPQREQPRSAPAERSEPRSQPAPQAPAVTRPAESSKPPRG